MARLWLPFFTQLAVIVCVGSKPQLQSVLNQFCAVNPDFRGCKAPSSNVGSGGTTSQGGVTSGGDGTLTCSISSRKCPELPSLCIPRDISCNVIGSAQRCSVPDGFGYSSQVLLCGDGTAVGIVCGNGSSVPVLTQLLVQCHGANLIDVYPVTELGVVSEQGKSSVGGVYRCNVGGSWEPLFGSSALRDLTRSCSNSGCGRVPQPTERMSIHRRWSWVRSIYFQGRIHCTATIVSPTAVLTAAHCLARSQVSRQPLSPTEFQVELPGPSSRIQRITVTPKVIHIHPRYSPQNGREHDLALMFFSEITTLNLPIVCIADSPNRPPPARQQVVFGLQPTAEEDPNWRTSEADWDASCRTISTRFSGSCDDQLIVHPFQFCASHTGLNVGRGSSGGPYLAEVGSGVEETWVIVGVLSHFSNESACDQDHSVYSLVAEDSKWIKTCLFDGRCD